MSTSTTEQQITEPAAATQPASTERNYWFEGLLELGRNWALAIAIASAGMTAFHSETISGPVNWQIIVFWGCVILSVLWVLLAVVRFDEGLARRLTTKRARAFGVVLYCVLFLMGSGLVILIGQFSDNNAIVRVCESMADQPESKVYKARECVRLRAQRQDYIDRLEGRKK